jgi:hypothetical protein
MIKIINRGGDRIKASKSESRVNIYSALVITSIIGGGVTFCYQLLDFKYKDLKSKNDIKAEFSKDFMIEFVEKTGRIKELIVSLNNVMIMRKNGFIISDNLLVEEFRNNRIALMNAYKEWKIRQEYYKRVLHKLIKDRADFTEQDENGKSTKTVSAIQCLDANLIKVTDLVISESSLVNLERQNEKFFGGRLDDIKSSLKYVKFSSGRIFDALIDNSIMEPDNKSSVQNNE